MAQATVPTRKRSRATSIVLGLGAALFIIAAIAITIWTTRCPCETMPGFMLLGSVQHEPVKDWTFANNVPFCQIQVSMYGLPHAINLNCFALPDGQLYLSCSVCARKVWAAHVGPNEHARLRLNERVYPVILNRVTDPALMDQVWDARGKKVNVYGGQPYNPKPKPGAKRPDTWWTFRVTSAVAG
jgi:hypothetical protein